MAWNRWKRSLYVRPQAWWTPIGLFAVIGPSWKLQRGPPAFWARSLANVPRSRQSSRISCSSATRSGRVGTGWNMGLRILPAMQSRHETAPRARSGFVAAFLSLLFPGLGHLYLGAYRRA